MSSRDIPYRVEIELEVPGTREQVWRALTTPEGLGGWMLPAEFEARPGAEIAFHMGPDATSHGRVVEVDEGRRIVYEEDWATLAGHEGADVSPMASEFVVAAQSGGTCVVRVVTSAFGSGAEWEREVFDSMMEGWETTLGNLRLYLTHFPDQQATPMWVAVDFRVSPEAATDLVRRSLGVDAVGDPVEVRGITGRIEGHGPCHVLVRVESPVAGLLSFYAYGAEGASGVVLQGYLFGAGAAGYAEREEPTWKAWLEGLTTEVGAAEPA
jgi:uncharacterized protein YndB with AHSA1/START domain